MDTKPQPSSALGQTTRQWMYAAPKSKHLCGKFGGSDALHTTHTRPLEQMTLNSCSTSTAADPSDLLTFLTNRALRSLGANVTGLTTSSVPAWTLQILGKYPRSVLLQETDTCVQT